MSEDARLADSLMNELCVRVMEVSETALKVILDEVLLSIKISVFQNISYVKTVLLSTNATSLFYVPGS